MLALLLNRRRVSALILALLPTLYPASSWSWGDRGHEIIGVIAERYLNPSVRVTVAALLASDSSGLTRTTGIVDETTWADKYRDSDRATTQIRYQHTQAWHYVDIEIDRADLNAACFGHPPIPPATAASVGPAEDCIVDKINQFRRELQSSLTAPDERRLALQYLLHFVGDIHQPLHAADDHDKGGNDKRVKTAAHASGTLHHYWDTVFVESLGSADAAAAKLLAALSARRRRSLSLGSPTEWAWQSFALGRDQVYGDLPRSAAGGAADVPRGEVLLSGVYEAHAQTIVGTQLLRAGLRLARLLNESLR